MRILTPKCSAILVSSVRVVEPTYTDPHSCGQLIATILINNGRLQILGELILVCEHTTDLIIVDLDYNSGFQVEEILFDDFRKFYTKLG